MFRHPRIGDELDWLAVDLHGHVGLFSTGGQGPVPEEVARQLTEVAAAIQRLSALPVVGACAESPIGGGNYESWIEPARRGIFGFDWGPVTDPPYVRLTVPTIAITVDEIADALVRHAAALAQIPVDFRTASRLSVDELGVRLFGEAHD
jgi:hypothetical protein